MNLRQVKWAEQHDWFVRSRRDQFGVYTVVCRPSYDGEPVQYFADYQALRAWAGY